MVKLLTSAVTVDVKQEIKQTNKCCLVTVSTGNNTSTKTGGTL